MELFYFENLLLGNGGWASWVEVNDTLGVRQVCQVEAWLRLGRDVVGMQVEVLEVWQVWVWAWGCRKLRCGMRLGTWRCGRLGPPATRGRSNLPHVAAPPATHGSSTCHTWQLHLPHVAGPPATPKRVVLPH